MSTKKPKTDNRERIELCDWNETVPASLQKRGNHCVLKTKCKGILTEADISRKSGIEVEIIRDLLTEVGVAVLHGFDVQLCDAIHFYACVNRTMDKPYIAAKTMGDFRKSISGKSVRLTRRGHQVSVSRAREIRREVTSRYINVTPDTVIKCPNCGTDIRVGKVLG